MPDLLPVRAQHLAQAINEPPVAAAGCSMQLELLPASCVDHWRFSAQPPRRRYAVRRLGCFRLPALQA